MRTEPDVVASHLPPGTAARRFHMVLPACPRAVRRTLADATGHCRRIGLHQDTAETVELVLAEVLNNVVEHALSGMDDGIIELELEVTSEEVRCRVRDDGSAMPDGQLPRGMPGTVGPRPADLPEGGFGWSLIRRLTEGVSYIRRDGWNTTRFAIPVQQHLDRKEPALN